MNSEAHIAHLVRDLEYRCRPAARYRVVWLAGAPRSGKTTLARALAKAGDWRYFNFTTEPEGLASIRGAEASLLPDAMSARLATLAASGGASILLIDEIEPLLSLWNEHEIQRFARQLSRAPRLASGLVVVTRFPSLVQTLPEIVPNSTHLIDLRSAPNEEVP